MYGPEGRTLDFNGAKCCRVRLDEHEQENITFFNATYTKILVHIEMTIMYII